MVRRGCRQKRQQRQAGMIAMQVARWKDVAAKAGIAKR
jgi:hypothetical protein